MKQSVVRSIIPFALAAALVFLAIPETTTMVHAQQPDSPLAVPLPRTITVVGEGTVTIKPDLARANIGVEVAANSVVDASEQNKVALESVLNALREQGIADEDIQTTAFSVYADRYGPDGPLSNEDVTYRVSNNVTVKIRDLDKVGEVLDAAIAAGANNIYGVDFALEEQTEAQSQARAEAVADAAAKAQELADLAGVTLGPIVSVSEIIGSSAGVYLGTMARAEGLGGSASPISPGDLEISQQIQAVYSIE